MQKKGLVASAYATTAAYRALVGDPLAVRPAASFIPAHYLEAKLPRAHLECPVHLTLLALLLHVFGDHGGVEYSVICHGERRIVASVHNVVCGTAENCLHNTNQREALRAAYMTRDVAGGNVNRVHEVGLAPGVVGTLIGK